VFPCYQPPSLTICAKCELILRLSGSDNLIRPFTNAAIGTNETKNQTLIVKVVDVSMGFKTKVVVRNDGSLLTRLVEMWSVCIFAKAISDNLSCRILQDHARNFF
jgi:hypothetical protein